MKSLVGVLCVVSANAQVPFQSFAPAGSVDGFNPSEKPKPATTYSKPVKHFEPTDDAPTVRVLSRPKWPQQHPNAFYTPAANSVGTVPADNFFPKSDAFVTTPAKEKSPFEHGLPLAIHGLSEIRSLQCLGDKKRNPYYECPKEQLVGGPFSPEHTETAVSVRFTSSTIFNVITGMFDVAIIVKTHFQNRLSSS